MKKALRKSFFACALLGASFLKAQSFEESCYQKAKVHNAAFSLLKKAERYSEKFSLSQEEETQAHLALIKITSFEQFKEALECYFILATSLDEFKNARKFAFSRALVESVYQKPLSSNDNAFIKERVLWVYEAGKNPQNSEAALSLFNALSVHFHKLFAEEIFKAQQNAQKNSGIAGYSSGLLSFISWRLLNRFGMGKDTAGMFLESFSHLLATAGGAALGYESSENISFFKNIAMAPEEVVLEDNDFIVRQARLDPQGHYRNMMAIVGSGLLFPLFKKPADRLWKPFSQAMARKAFDASPFAAKKVDPHNPLKTQAPSKQGLLSKVYDWNCAMALRMSAFMARHPKTAWTLSFVGGFFHPTVLVSGPLSLILSNSSLKFVEGKLYRNALYRAKANVEASLKKGVSAMDLQASFWRFHEAVESYARYLDMRFLVEYGKASQKQADRYNRAYKNEELFWDSFHSKISYFWNVYLSSWTEEAQAWSDLYIAWDMDGRIYDLEEARKESRALDHMIQEGLVSEEEIVVKEDFFHHLGATQIADIKAPETLYLWAEQYIQSLKMSEIKKSYFKYFDKFLEAAHQHAELFQSYKLDEARAQRDLQG